MFRNNPDKILMEIEAILGNFGFADKRLGVQARKSQKHRNPEIGSKSMAVSA
jgi:hypothetical protein